MSHSRTERIHAHLTRLSRQSADALSRRLGPPGDGPAKRSQLVRPVSRTLSPPGAAAGSIVAPRPFD